MVLVKPFRLFPFLALVLILVSLVSTETAEVWCRVAVGATLDTDDDDSLYFRSQGKITPVSGKLTRAFLSAAPSDSAIVDEPTFNLPPLYIVTGPLWTPHICIVGETVVYAAETREPAARLIRFVRPPPRAPPIS